MESNELEKLSQVRSKLYAAEISNAGIATQDGGLLSQLSANPFFTAVSFASSLLVSQLLMAFQGLWVSWTWSCTRHCTKRSSSRR